MLVSRQSSPPLFISLVILLACILLKVVSPNVELFYGPDPYDPYNVSVMFI